MQVTKNAIALAIALAAAPAFSQYADARSRHYGHHGYRGHYGHGHYGHPGAFIGGFAAGAFLGAFARPYYGYGYYAPRYYYPPPAYFYPQQDYYHEDDYYGGYDPCAEGGVVSRPAHAMC